MHSKLLISATLLSTALALPGGSKGGNYGGQKRKTVIANFDDLPAAPLDLSPVGDYKYLEYQGFSVGTEELLGVQIFGVTPQSAPNVAYSDAISDTFTGPALLADYDGSKTKSFDLKSFYYGCIDVSETPVATAENCTITATGYKSGTQVATQTFTYSGDSVLTGNLDATMTLGTFTSDFKALTEVDFTYAASNTVDAPPSLIVDDVKYVVYLKGGKKGHYSS